MFMIQSNRFGLLPALTVLLCCLSICVALILLYHTLFQMSSQNGIAISVCI